MMDAIGQWIVSTILMGLLSWLLITFGATILNYFVALGAPPKKRAALTVLPVALAVTAVMIFSVHEGGAIQSAIGSILAGLVVYFWFYERYQDRWYESADDMPDDMPRQNEDWRLGLQTVAALAIAAVVMTLIRRML